MSEWRGLQHIPVSASFEPMSAPFDYLHVNSIQPLPDGNLLVSGRHTWAVYKLDRRTGEVIWTLGGKRSQFQMGPGTQFAWQHDPILVSDRLLTVFDNGTNGPIKTEHQSRGLALEVDEHRRTVTLRNAYTSPQHLSAGAMGSVQTLSADRVLVSFGVQSHTIEYASDGTLLLDIALPAGMYSYRGLWLPWKGSPHHRARPGRKAGPPGRHHDHVRQLERRHRSHGLAGRRGLETTTSCFRSGSRNAAGLRRSSRSIASFGTRQSPRSIASVAGCGPAPWSGSRVSSAAALRLQRIARLAIWHRHRGPQAAREPSGKIYGASRRRSNWS